MIAFFKKNYVYISLVFLALTFAVLSAFGLGNFNSPSSYYQTGEIGDDSYFNSLCYTLDFTESKYSLDSVWINFGGKDYSDGVDEITVYASVASSDSTRFYSLKTFSDYESETESDCSVLNADGRVKAGDWQVLCKNTTSYKTYKYFLLSTKNKIKINEIAFVGVGEDGSRVLLKATAFGAGGKKSYYNSDSPLDKSGEFPTDDDAKSLAGALIDEQNKFDLSKIDFDNYVYIKESGLTDYERLTIESVRNLTSGRGVMIDASVNPFGQYLIAAGVGVFGATSFGVRVVPFIFATLTLVLAYFIGTLFTGKSVYGLIFAFLYAVGGYSLFFATAGRVDAVFAFFILCAFYSVLKFVKKGVSGSAPRKGFVNIILGGAAFSAALAIKSTATFYILPILGIFIFGVVKQYAYAKNKGVNKTESFKNKFGITVALGAAGYVLLPVISLFAFFLFGYSAYSAYYGVSGITGYISRAFWGLFSSGAHNAATYSSPIGFIVNYSAQAESARKFAFGNLALIAVNLFSLIFCGAALISRFVGKNDNLLFSKDGGLRVYIAFAVFALFGWLLSLTLKCGAGEFYLPSVFMSGISVLTLKTLNDEDNKPIIGKSVTVTKLCAAVIGSVILVFFALAVPAFIGLAADKGIYAFQVINRAAF